MTKAFPHNLKLSNIVVAVAILMLCVSCNVTKQIPKDRSILRNNFVVEEDKELDIISDFFAKDEIEKIPKQKPNKKVIKMPVSEWIWSFYNTKRITRFTQTMKTKVGSAPVLFDSTLLEPSKYAFSNYYFNNGYFDNKVSVEVKTKKQITNVTYKITLNEPYKINNVILDTSTLMKREVFENMDKSFLKKGQVFNIDNLIAERERINNVAKDIGYFTFNKNYVKYDLDTFKNKKTIDIYLDIDEESDTSEFEKHYIDSIYVRINNAGEGLVDTGTYEETIIDNIHFFQAQPKEYKESYLSKFIYRRKDKLYSKVDIENTLKKITGLNNFQLVNTSYNLADPKANKLNTLYSLTPYDKFSFRLGQSLYGSTLGFIGTEMELSLTNNNLTKHADRLKLSLSGAVEFSFLLNNNKNYSGLVSRLDVSTGAKYSIDKFLLPFPILKDEFYQYSKTDINGKYTLSRRLGYYDIHNLGINLGETWSKNGLSRFTYKPLIFNFIYIPDNSITSGFQETLDRNPFLKSSFTSSFILGSSFMYEYIKNIGKKDNTFKLNVELETAGNSAYFVNKALRFTDKDELNINGINVSQYAMLQNQLTYSQVINSKTSLNYKLKTGVVIPYGNSSSAPYIKQFFIGGQNSLRGFQVRTIGPGAFNPGSYDTDTSKYPRDQLGNIVIEGSAEYRFDIISMFKGAVFMDYGNIWYSNSNYHTSEKAIFDISQFYKQMYVNGGLGIRVDVEFFILRFDFGFPVRVPYLDSKDWVILDAKPFNDTWIRNNIVFNFAVGYPF